MPNALTRRLEEYVPLTDGDREELARLCAQSTRTIQAKRDLICEGDVPRAVFVILDGWACHYRHLEDGSRQIVDFAIPGDLCDLNLFILDRMDHSIGAITRLKVAEVGREMFHSVVTNYPNITDRALVGRVGEQIDPSRMDRQRWTTVSPPTDSASAL